MTSLEHHSLDTHAFKTIVQYWVGTRVFPAPFLTGTRTREERRVQRVPQETLRGHHQPWGSVDFSKLEERLQTLPKLLLLLTQIPLHQPFKLGTGHGTITFVCHKNPTI